MAVIRSLLLAAVAVATVSCGRPVPAATTASPGQPSTQGQVVEIRYEDIPWCLDSSGHSPVYPCRWDARERPPWPPWDRQATRIAIWVLREVGCAGLFAAVRTPEVSPYQGDWSCYYAPEETTP